MESNAYKQAYKFYNYMIDLSKSVLFDIIRFLETGA